MAVSPRCAQSRREWFGRCEENRLRTDGRALPRSSSSDRREVPALGGAGTGATGGGHHRARSWRVVAGLESGQGRLSGGSFRRVGGAKFSYFTVCGGRRGGRRGEMAARCWFLVSACWMLI